MRQTFFTAFLIAALSGPAYAEPAACTLVSAAEMAAIIGGTLTAEPDDREGQTKCTYAPQDGFTPYAELQISWHDGKPGMAGAKAMSGQLKDVTSEFTGLGDEATSVGPMILIRRGADLITLVLSGIDDSPGKAKRIYAIVDERLTKPASPDRH